MSTTIDMSTGMYKFTPPVHQQRCKFVIDTLNQSNWSLKFKKIAEFNCGHLTFLPMLATLQHTTQLLAIDPHEKVLNHGIRRLPKIIESIGSRAQPLHVSMLQGNIYQYSKELENVDAVVAIEVIEHLDENELRAVPKVVFQCIQPYIALFTTPNADFNKNFYMFNSKNGLRKGDHKFEWTRAQFKTWCHQITTKYTNYSVFFSGVGEGLKTDPDRGYVSQIATFVRLDLLREDMTIVRPINNYNKSHYSLIKEFVLQ